MNGRLRNFEGDTRYIAKEVRTQPTSWNVMSLDDHELASHLRSYRVVKVPPALMGYIISAKVKCQKLGR